MYFSGLGVRMICANTRLTCFVFVTLSLISPQCSWAVVYNESIDGDLSGNRLSPTHLTLPAGVHPVTATTGRIEGDEVTYDQEYLRIDLPANHKLIAINMEAYDSFDGTAFIGVQAGTTFSFEPEDARDNVASLLGWAHFGFSEGHSIGDDILPSIGAAGRGSAGFTPPLVGPSFTFWLQQTGDDTTYQLDFVVVPEPAAFVSILAVGTLFAFRRKPRTGMRNRCSGGRQS
jgi:hypothetical protein